MASRQLTIEFIGDAKPVTKAFGEVEESGGKLEAKMSGLSGAFGNVATVAGGVLAAGAIGKLTSGLGGAIAAAAADEQATMRLEQALRNAGGAFDENLAAVNAAIAAGQKKAFTDDDVRDSFQSLLAATGDVNESLERQKLAMDLSRGAGISLEQASKMLGKVNAENVEAFKRLGITIGDNATEAEALAAVQAKFAGQADTYANSTAGQFEQAQIRMDELKETIGAALLPAVTALAAVFLDKVVPVFEFLAAHIDQLMPIFAGMAVAVGVGLTAAFYSWAVAANAAEVANLAAAAASALALAPYIAIGVAIVAVVAGIILLIKHWDDITAKFPALGVASDAVKAKFDVLVGWITGTFVPAVLGIYNGVKDAVDQTVGYVRDHWDEIRAVIEPAVKALEIIVSTAWNQVKIQIEMYLGVIKGIVDVFMGIFTGDWDRAWKGVEEIVTSIWNGMKGTIENVLGLIKGLAPIAKDAALALGRAMKDGVVEGFGAIVDEAQSLAGQIIGAFKAAWNAGIDWADRHFKLELPGVEVKGVTLVPGFTWDPDLSPLKLAKGGIVTKPTLAIIGEAGPEAVVPLSRGVGVGLGGPQIIQLVVDGAVLAEVVNRENGRAY